MAPVAPVIAALPKPALGAGGVAPVVTVVLVLVAFQFFFAGTASVGTLVVGFASLAGAIGLWLHSAKGRKARLETREKFTSIDEQFQTALASLRAVENRHGAEFKTLAHDFTDRLQKLTTAHGQLRKIPMEMSQELASLNARKREFQLQAFLQAQFIDKARIAGIGPGRKAVLASHGVETAWDITNHQLAGISGVGPVARQALFAWRASVESRFAFDAARAIDPVQQRLIQQKYATKTAQLRAALTSGAAPLRGIAADLAQKRRQATSEIGVIQEQLRAMKARVDELTEK
jgi:DNA-binding helix-hairpin-helix protein with protein kinase domain